MCFTLHPWSRLKTTTNPIQCLTVWLQLRDEPAPLQGVGPPLVHAGRRGAGVRRHQGHVQRQQERLRPGRVLVSLQVRHQLPMAAARAALLQGPGQPVEGLLRGFPGRIFILDVGR